jgi:hypothetical protein
MATKLQQALDQLRSFGAACPTVYAHIESIENLRFMAMMNGVQVSRRWSTEGGAPLIVESCELEVDGVSIHVSAFRKPTWADKPDVVS